MRAALAVLALLLVPASAFAQVRTMAAIWTIEPTAELPPEQDVSPDGWVLQQRLVPGGLFALDGTAVVGQRSLFSTGGHLIQVAGEEAIVACDPVAQKQKLIGSSQYCLIDYDRDGKFEGYFAVVSASSGLPTIQGNYPKKAKAIVPVPYHRVDPAEFSGNFFVGIRYSGKAALYDKLNFYLCYGSEQSTGCLTEFSYTSGSIFPASLDLLRSRLTILSRTGGVARIRVERGMPAQPFGIIQTTSYTIY